LFPLSHLLAYQKLRERIIYETCLAGFRLGSADAGDACVCHCNKLKEEMYYSQRRYSNLDPVCGNGRYIFKNSLLLLMDFEVLFSISIS